MGKKNALTAAELADWELFKTSDCVACHNGSAAGGNSFQKIGIVEPYKATSAAEGRYAVTGRDTDRFNFKVPTLRRQRTPFATRAMTRSQQSPSYYQAMRKLPPLSALRCFEVAGDYDSFTLAAQKLCLSPSAVSHHIRLLEDYLDAQLFDRVGKRVALTQTGRAYHAKVRQAFDLISEVTGDVRGRRVQRQAIYIRAAHSFGSAWLTPHLAEFLNEFADVEIHVATGDYPSALGSTRVDCEITYGRPTQSDVRSLPLCTERLIPVCSASVARSVGEPLQLLQAVTLIHTQSRPIGWREFFREHRHLGVVRRASSDHALFFDRSTVALEAAREGLGIALESDILAQGDLANGRLVAPFGGTGIAGETYYFVAREASEGSIVYAFYRWLRNSILQSRGDAAGLQAA